MEQLVPLPLQHLRLKGTNVDDDSLVRYLESNPKNILKSIDLSAVNKEGSTRISDVAIHAILVIIALLWIYVYTTCGTHSNDRLCILTTF